MDRSDIKQARGRLEDAASRLSSTPSEEKYHLRNQGSTGYGYKQDGRTVKMNSQTGVRRYSLLVDALAGDYLNNVVYGSQHEYRILDVGSSFGTAAEAMKLDMLQQVLEDTGRSGVDDRVSVFELDVNPQVFGLGCEGDDWEDDYAESGMGDIISNPFVGPAQELPFNENEFDAVISHQALTPLGDKEIDQSIQEMKRVVKPGGLFYISTGDHERDEDCDLHSTLDGKDSIHWEDIRSKTFSRARSASTKRIY